MPLTSKRLPLFCLALMLILSVNFSAIVELVRYALRSDFASHIILVPFIVVALIYRKWKELSDMMEWGALVGSMILVFGCGAWLVGRMVRAQLSYNDYLSLNALSLVCLLIGLFVLFYGPRSSRMVLFPLLFLFFMIPLPEFILKNSIEFLLKGSAEATAIVFNLTGTPFFRDGYTFRLPGASIEIAPQCSGIRSSMALLITVLLASYLVLTRIRNKLIMILLVIPSVMLKNAIRIVVLSLLAIHVDMKFLTGSDLHRRGGMLFFLIILSLLLPILRILQRSEQNAGPSAENAL